MIHKLKRKFTILATVSMFVLMSVLVLIMNIVNYSSVVSESDSILDVLSTPEFSFFGDRGLPFRSEIFNEFIIRGMSPEVLYESRYFTVTVTSDGRVKESDLSKIVSVDEESALYYISRAFFSKKSRDFIGEFRYAKVSDGQMTKILFLDCGRKLSSFKAFMWTSIAVGFFGCVVMFVTFLLVSGNIVKPIAESYEKQKRFISDAGHEIKTPLTIINANVDLLESEGEKEELADIRRETQKLTKLTNDLVTLSKMEETTHKVTKIEFPVSDLVAETVGSFSALIYSKNISLTSQITPSLTLNASPEGVRQLVSILMDNSVKYTPLGGYIAVGLTKYKKSVVLTVTNSLEERIDENSLKYVFDRFYRADESRNSVTGGHGIGLSIAKAITDSHGGTITAATRTGFDFTVNAVFPV